MRSALVVLLLVTCAWARATDALVLISPAAGPVVDQRNYIHGEWVLWPPADQADGNNRILSLLTGMDWQGGSEDLAFGFRDGHYLYGSLGKLTNRGYFAARDRYIGMPSFAIGSANGLASPIALFLALNGRTPEETPLSFQQEWPPGIVFAQVEDWDRVAAIAAKARGRTLVVEYPPAAGQRWSRFWLRGSGWGSKVPYLAGWGVPGLIPASQVGHLLAHPEQFAWAENDTGNWGGANRWFAFIAYTSPLTIAILSFLAAFFVGCTVYLVSREEHAKLAGVAIKYLTLIPASILLAGPVTRYLGFNAYGLWLLFAFLSLAFASQILGSVCARLFPGSHPMFAMFAVGMAAVAASGSLWSMYSNIFGVNLLPVAPEAVGALIGYLVGLCSFARGSRPAVWVGRVAVVFMAAWGLSADPWWVSGQWPFATLPLVAIVAGERLFQLWMLPGFALIPLFDGHLLRHGFVWAPGNLYPSLAQSQAVNLARHVEFLVSHGFLGSAVVAGVMAIFVERYFFHELRRTLLRDSRTKALFFASFCCLAMGLAQPLLLYAALTCFVGGAFVVLSDTARAV